MTWSREIFARSFSEESLNDVIDLHLAPSVARGVDGVTYEQFHEEKDREVALISSRAIAGEYRFTPYRQKLILKNPVSPPRQVSIPTIRDRIALRALSNFLSEAFHSAKPQHTHPVISGVISSIKKSTASDAFIKLDIKSFYDMIDHRVLLKSIRAKVRSREPISIIEAALRTPTGATIAERKVNDVGVPQGLSISNILASIYLSSIDTKYSSRLGLSYNRYVDDILCLVAQDEANEVASSITAEMRRKKKLTVHPIGSGKSSIVPATQRIEYLGYAFHGTRISVRRDTEKKLLSNLMQIIQGASQETLHRDIWRINLRISGCRLNDSNVGWIFYFSQINDLQLISRIDAQVKKAVTRKFSRDDYDRCKRLVKAYHEVKYHYLDSSYFHNFDTYDKEQMTTLLRRIFPGRFPNLMTKSEIEVRKIFNRVVTREVRQMERDTMGSFS
ncbi:Reverse transcriptase (RNA-dependent DNA polymerase) [Palleronia marisminoris]|uniref:Reverse transcriptase (RNA-dependent DNA polymerase) n=1 Tax=Palleronia marisminoris TaxID=315423 RepID=A0A1Y5SXL0_9RHOB|nr:reverse transcriptase domain-containing protein [Palleronia marisminoris]SFG96782.1 Reverse transcriptase (RNA-dependent DNA polymerase) [Palleronia marisminoris]SLN47460.1 Reverse transcriptase (RNA-dependent DNA polymerase) [Palleronia marisminoris]